MNFKSKWYSAENNPLEIPTFLDLQNVTGQVFDDFGNYIGKKELPEQQLVINESTKRQYYAPKEYDDDAIRYAQAKLDESFSPEEWYGMTKIKPHFKLDEQIIGGAAAVGKEAIGMFAQIPTKIVYAGTVGLNYISRGNFQNAEILYRSSMRNWEETLSKYGLTNEPEIQEMLGGKIGTTIGGVAGSLLTAAAVSSVGGLPAVAAVFGSNQFADVMEEGLAKGLSHNKAFAAAWKAGMAEGSLEALGFKFWKSAATLSKSFRNKMIAFAWESTQEGSQQVAESIITNYYGIREQTFLDIMADVLLSALVGGVVGFAGAAVTGQVEQRNLALRNKYGMNEEGRITTPKSEKKEEGKVLQPTQADEKFFIEQEIAEAKKTGDNKLYNLVRYSANAHGITDEATIDKMYPVARKAIADGATNEVLLDILGNQVVAYKNQLEQGQTNTKATKKAVEEIKLVSDPNRVDEWKESRKSQLEKIGVEKREARVAMSHFAKAVSNLSRRLGFDITKKYDLQFEKRAPQSETLQQIKDEEELSFDFGANVESNQQKGIATKGKLIETYRTLEEGLKAKKAPMPRRHLLTVLREKGANYENAGAVDKESYKNAKVPNRKDGIGDSLSDFLAQHGFMSKGASEAQTYEEASELEQEAADLIDRALSGEKIFTLADQEIITQREAQEEGQEWAEQEMAKIRVDLTRGQTKFLGKVVKIALGETFDFSTLEHEFFHFIDRVVLDAAREGNPEAQKILSKRNQIIKKAKAELKKQGFIEPKDNEERAKLIKQGKKVMPIDEEILAEAYEKWLWNGAKSEDKAEQGLFNAIREFFREVYETVKGLVGVRITPEMDAYFKAMTGEGPQTLYQFGGITARTADHAALTRAGEMMAEGKSNEEIRKETGWFRGVDGKWRFEISDKDMEISDKSYDYFANYMEASDRAQEAYAKIKQLSDKRKNETDEKKLAELENTIEKYEDDFRKANLDKAKYSGYLTLEELIKHDKLFKAYPDFRNIAVAVSYHAEDNRLATYSIARNAIYFNGDMFNDKKHKYNKAYPKEKRIKEIKSALMHEVQHAIQEREGFATGANLEAFREAPVRDRITKDIMEKRKKQAKADFAHELEKRTGNKEIVKELLAEEKNFSDVLDKFFKNEIPQSEAAKEQNKFNDLLKKAGISYSDYFKLYDDMMEKNGYDYKRVEHFNPYDPYELYRMVAGEIEARNTEARLEMSEEERAATSPESTQDIKNADAIVVFDDGTELVYQTTEAPTTLFQNIKYDKNGKADTNSPEFKKWFGDSKVVDENGQPLVVYHNTDAQFAKFDKSKIGTKTDHGMHGRGFYFSSEKDQTYMYGNRQMPVYLAIKNPLRLGKNGQFEDIHDYGNAKKGIPSINSRADYEKYKDKLPSIEEITEMAKQDGYDGIIVKPLSGAKDEYIVFEPTQIKSVYNRGTFDTESPNIYYQQETNEQLFRNNQAIKEGAKVLDKAPTNEQVEEELATIRSGRVVEAEPKRGFGLAESIGDFVLTVRQRVGTIDKRLKYAFDKLDFNEKMYESKYGKNVVGYIKKYRKLDETKKRELDYLILNKQDERIREFVRQNDMLEEYNQARTLLDELYVEGNKAGMDMGFLQEYFPTKVVDPEGLITYLKGTDKWTEIERALAEIDPNNQMSIEDRANAINNILRGYNRADPISKQGFQNERLIFHKTPEMMKFYAPSDEALMRYVSGMSSALAIRNAFNVKNAFNAEESIGGVVQELIKSGQITYKEEAFIRKMLKARLNYARTAPMVALLKNFGYLGTMNNITSAVTQIGDLYANFYKYNFGTAMKALFGKREITKEDLHIDSIWEEFADAGWTGIAVNKLFSAIGLNKFDKFGKETAINGAWIDLKERLKNNDVSLLEDLSAAFGSRAKQVMEDIKNNNITEDVKLLLWTQLADTQPLGKSGVPVGYLNNPHGRIVYQLKTYTINQLSLFYADGIYKINKGIATKNKKLFLQGVGNTAKLALLLTIFNAGADVLKNLIMGRKVDISDTLLSNMLWNIGVSKYTFYRGQRDGYARALIENYLLPPQVSMGDDAYMDIKKIATGKRKPSDTVAVTYVPFGRMWYWWFGGGRTQEKKKGNKPFEVEL